MADAQAPAGAALPAGVTSEALPTVRPSGRALAGVLTTPAAPSADVVLLFHGLLSNMDHSFAPVLADRISRTLGLSTYRFNFRTGPTPEEPGARYRFCGFEEDVDDAVCAAEMLRARGLRVVAAVGHSRGGNIALLYGALPPPPGQPHPVVAALAPRFRVPGTLDKFDAAAVAALESGAVASFDWDVKGSGFAGTIQVTRDDVTYVRSGLDMGAVVRSLPAALPLLLVHGAADKTIPADDSRMAADARPAGTTLHVISGANHTFQGTKVTEKLLGFVLDFLRAHVPGCLPAPEAAPAAPAAAAAAAAAADKKAAKVKGGTGKPAAAAPAAAAAAAAAGGDAPAGGAAAVPSRTLPLPTAPVDEAALLDGLEALATTLPAGGEAQLQAAVASGVGRAAQAGSGRAAAPWFRAF